MPPYNPYVPRTADEIAEKYELEEKTRGNRRIFRAVLFGGVLITLLVMYGLPMIIEVIGVFVTAIVGSSIGTLGSFGIVIAVIVQIILLFLWRIVAPAYISIIVHEIGHVIAGILAGLEGAFWRNLYVFRPLVGGFQPPEKKPN